MILINLVKAGENRKNFSAPHIDMTDAQFPFPRYNAPHEKRREYVIELYLCPWYAGESRSASDILLSPLHSALQAAESA